MVCQLLNDLLVLNLHEVFVLRKYAAFVEYLSVLMPVADKALTLTAEAPVDHCVLLKEAEVVIFVLLRALVEEQFRVVEYPCNDELVQATVIMPSNSVHAL